MASEESSQQKLAAFNSALGVTVRINQILNRAWMFRETLDAYGWYNSLKSLQLECWTKLTKKSQEQTDQILNEIQPMINNWTKRTSQGQIVGMPTILYDKLNMLEKELRTAADKAGLLIPDQANIYDLMNQF